MKRFAGKAVARLLKRRWTDDDAEKYIGHFSSAWLAHSSDDSLRVNAASGGAVSAMLIELLAGGEIDGALCCRAVIREGKVRAEYFIARTRDDILASQGSKYVPVRFSGDALPLIKSFDGALAVVGLPCDIGVMRRRMEKDPAIGAKVKCTIAIVCGHNSEPDLVDQVTERLERETGDRISGYRFRRGHWRGNLCASFEGGTEIEQPFSSRFGLYQNLYFWSERKCFQCHDHYGYAADISMGDVWSHELRDNPIKQSGVLIKTEPGRRLFERAVARGALDIKPVPVNLLLDGQARTAPFHYNVTARVATARARGLKLKDVVGERARWNDRLAARLALFNWRWSRSARWRGAIFRIPRPVLKLYLYFFKFLESL